MNPETLATGKRIAREALLFAVFDGAAASELPGALRDAIRTLFGRNVDAALARDFGFTAPGHAHPAPASASAASPPPRSP